MNSITDKEIKEQGNIMALIRCDECEYSTDFMKMESAVFMVNMQGGYFSFDGIGGAISQCPLCGEDKLIIGD